MPSNVNLSLVLPWCKDHRIGIAKVAISGFILWYFGTILFWVGPQFALSKKIVDDTSGIFHFFGFNQRWSLFGPDIRDINFHATAFIGFEDGTIGSWELPRVDYMDQLRKYTKDKFRKWDVDSLPWAEMYGEFYPSLARYVGRLHYDEHNKPVWMMLTRYSGRIPDPNKQIVPRDSLPERTRMDNVFFYKYKPEDLKCESSS